MHRDVSEIRQFYQSPLGRLTAKILGDTIRAFTSDAPAPQQDDCLVGVGYPLPYFDQWHEQNTIAVMGAKQGVVRWPAHGPSRIVLTEDHILPFADQSIEQIFMVHAIESADYLRELMDEVWRVLKPNGRVVLVVPNRAGLWAKSDRTPFGYGRPFSMKQIRALLYDAQFVIENDRRALYFMPSHNRLSLWMAPMLEKLGEIVMPRLGGVMLIEASKRLYNATPIRVTQTAPKPKIAKPDWVTEPVPT